MTKHNDQLLPCPFCGGEEPTHEESDTAAWVECTALGCGACGPLVPNESVSGREKAAQAWNARAQLPAGGAVPDAVRTLVEIAASLCTTPLRELDIALDQPRLSRKRVENAAYACRNRLSQYAIDLRRAADGLLTAAPHPVSGEFNPEHTLFNEIRGSMPVNEDDEPARYIINEAQLQRIRALEFDQHPVSGHLIRFDFINADGNPDSKMITHDEMRERCAAQPTAQDVSGLPLIETGNPLSNAAYNLAQKPGHVLTDYDCELLAELRRRWDEALAAHRAQQGGQ